MGPADMQGFLTTGVFAFILVFVRVGTAIMVMPGIGNAFVPANIRLYFALAFAFVIFPVVQSRIPNPIPETFTLFTMIIMEFVVNEDGSIGKVGPKAELRDKYRPDFIEESVRVIRAMPKWIPGENKGQKVKCMVTLPIKYKLE